MGMKRPRVFALYRAGAPETPSAAMDQLILSMARVTRDSMARVTRDSTSRVRHESRLPARLAAAAALALVAIFATRGMLPVKSPAPEITVTDFGVAEGQAHAWLVSFQPSLTATGPGSQEGLP